MLSDGTNRSGQITATLVFELITVVFNTDIKTPYSEEVLYIDKKKKVLIIDCLIFRAVVSGRGQNFLGNSSVVGNP